MTRRGSANPAIGGDMRRRVGPLGGAQFGRTRARIGATRRRRAGGRLVRISKLGAAWACSGKCREPPPALPRSVEKILDDAVFQRMERHHRQPAAGLQHAFRRRQRQLQLVEFFIDEDTHA